MNEIKMGSRIRLPLIVVSETAQPLDEIIEYYNVTEYQNVKEAQRYIFRHTPQIVLVFTDSAYPQSYTIMLPGFTVIIVTDNEELLSQRWSDSMGAFDVINKDTMFADPVRRLYVYQSLRAIIDRYKNKPKTSSHSIFKELCRITHETDEVTGRHHINSVRFLHTMYQSMKNIDKRRTLSSSINIREDVVAAILHDVGKLFVPNKILMKPGALTKEEFAVVKNHTTDGKFVIHRLSKELKQISGLYKHIPCVELHHEKWDGSGYPHGLKKNQIPLLARMMTITDVYDALTAKRPYKDPFPHDKAVAIITDGSGTHFDPSLIEVFHKASPKLEVIAGL